MLSKIIPNRRALLLTARKVIGAGLVLALAGGFAAFKVAGAEAQAPSDPRSVGTVAAWGANGQGQLGNGTTASPNPAPSVIAGLSRIKAVSASLSHVGADDAHSLAIDSKGTADNISDDTVWAWGFNSKGQLGLPVQPPSPPRSLVPVEISQTLPQLVGVKAIDAGGRHSLALLANGTVLAWGDNSCKQLGPQATAAGGPAPVQVTGLPQDIVAISAGARFSMALASDGVLWAWGDNSNGQLGNGLEFDPVFLGRCDTDREVVTQAEPSQVKITRKVVQVAAGVAHSLALTDDGSVWAWGRNQYGEIGISPQPEVPARRPHSGVPVRMLGLPAGASSVAAGYDHSMALINGEVWTWGRNSHGQLGNGTANPNVNPYPTKVKNTASTALSNVLGIDSGAHYDVALGSDEQVWGWGNNLSAQLGRPPSIMAQSNFAIPVSGLGGPLAAVSAGQGHVLALFGPPPPAPGPGGNTDLLPFSLPSVSPPDLPDKSDIDEALSDASKLVDKSRPKLPADDGVSAPVRDLEPFASQPTGIKPANGSVFATGRWGLYDADPGCQFREENTDRKIPCPATFKAQRFIRKAVAYVAPQSSTPRILLIAARPDITSRPDISSRQFRALEASGFPPCSDSPQPPTSGCFDFAQAYKRTAVENAKFGNHETGSIPGGLELEDVDFSHYDLLMVSPLYLYEMDLLEERMRDIYDYVNAGGGLIAFAQNSGYSENDRRAQGRPDRYPGDSGFIEYLRFLPFLTDLSFQLSEQRSPLHRFGYTSTPKGREMGLTDDELNGWQAVNTYFAESCGFDVLEVDRNKRIISMATRKTIPTPCSGVKIPNLAVREGDAGTTPAVVEISLADVHSEPLSLDYATADGSAHCCDGTGPDYVPASGRIEFAPGETTKTITVPVRGDSVPEADETVLLKLSNASINLEITATLTIINDDGLPATNKDGEGAGTGTGSDSSKRGLDEGFRPNPAGAAKSAAAAPALAPVPGLAPALAPAPSTAQASSQSQAGSQSHASSHSPTAVHALQAGLTPEKERKTEVEKAKIAPDPGQTDLLASSRSRNPAPGLGLGALALLNALWLGLKARRSSFATDSETISVRQERSEQKSRRLRRLHGQH